MKYFFRAISYLLHPLLMPMLGLFLLFESPSIPNSLMQLDALYFFPENTKMGLYLVLAVLAVVAPGFSLLIMYWNKMISDLEISKREERFYPYILIIIYYSLAFGFMKIRLNEAFQHPALMSMIFGIIVVFVAAFFLNFKIKVSMHAAGIFGVCGALLAYNQSQIESNMSLIFYLICLGGLVAASRIYLGAHNLKETIAGMALGFGVLFVCVKFSLFI